MSDTAAFSDPYRQPDSDMSTLTDVRPKGYKIELNDDGTSTVIDPTAEQANPAAAKAHFVNLANVMDETDLDNLCNDLLEAIDEDKEARQPRDRQYQEGLNRTGMGDNIIGGATFPGASRAVHPLLLESSLDFGAAMMNEMLPPEGPCKSQVQGDESGQKDDRAKRIARWINYQFSEVMPGAYHEFEVGFTQCPLGGAFYTKLYDENGNPAISFVPVDHVYRPFSDGDFYNQPRITHAQPVDKWEYSTNVKKKLWRDVVAFDAKGGMLPEETMTDRANDRIVGQNTPTRNVDAIREVYETSTMLELLDDKDLSPYLVTIDVEARKVLAIYRNWAEGDESKKRLRFLIEWGFWPWRGGYPVGLTHMIGSLAGATTGALRALLDAAMLNTSQTGMRLKGGAGSGGQNMTPRVTEISEIQGSLAQDDIRKTFMPIKFNEPSGVMLNLLGFLVDAGRGVVRSTYDDMDKFGSQTPVGTTQMFLEQGLRNMGSVHGRFHRAMRFLLQDLYQFNKDTLTNAQVMDAQGELTVTQADFQGPMSIIPVSDPKLFSALIRRSLAQTIVARAGATQQAGLPIYNARNVEVYFLKQMGLDDPDQVLNPSPQPTRTNAVAENVVASSGGPVKAFPGQDHEAHIHVHLAFLQSPIFGSNASLAAKYIPVMVEHLGQHLAMWYSDAMLEAATQALREQSGNDAITLDSFMGVGVEAPLDQLMDLLDDDIMALAMEKLESVPAAIEEARATLKRLAPPQPMDPSLVAQDDVQRQREKDQADGKAKVIDLQTRRAAIEQQGKTAQQKLEAEREAKLRADALKAEELRQKAQKDAGDQQLGAAEIDAHNARNDDDNATAIEITEMKNASVEKTAEQAAKARADAPPSAPGRGNIKTGTGLGRSGDGEE
ncbi:MAG: cell envelope integrity protein TolA [Hyphomicrobium sp.]|jgi:hypothetical protein